MPYTKILSISCHKTYNSDGKDSVILNLIDELGNYTFTADNMEANSIREVNDGLKWFGQAVELNLILEEPNVQLGRTYIRNDSVDKGEIKKRFTNQNRNYEYEISYEVTDH
jgi:hypothetical protein